MNRIACDDPAAVKFQRLIIALICLMSVLFRTPLPLYLIIVTTLPGIFLGSDRDGLVLFYRGVLQKIVGRSLFSFEGKATGLYLVGLEAETFIYSVMSIFIGTGIVLSLMGVTLWILPIAIVAAGMALAATTGICLMSLFYLQVRKLWSHG